MHVLWCHFPASSHDSGSSSGKQRQMVGQIQSEYRNSLSNYLDGRGRNAKPSVRTVSAPDEIRTQYLRNKTVTAKLCVANRAVGLGREGARGAELRKPECDNGTLWQISHKTDKVGRYSLC